MWRYPHSLRDEPRLEHLVYGYSRPCTGLQFGGMGYAGIDMAAHQGSDYAAAATLEGHWLDHTGFLESRITEEENGFARSELP